MAYTPIQRHSVGEAFSRAVRPHIEQKQAIARIYEKRYEHALDQQRAIALANYQDTLARKRQTDEATAKVAEQQRQATAISGVYNQIQGDAASPHDGSYGPVTAQTASARYAAAGPQLFNAAYPALIGAGYSTGEIGNVAERLWPAAKAPVFGSPEWLAAHRREKAIDAEFPSAVTPVVPTQYQVDAAVNQEQLARAAQATLESTDKTYENLNGWIGNAQIAGQDTVQLGENGPKVAVIDLAARADSLKALRDRATAVLDSVRGSKINDMARGRIVVPGPAGAPGAISKAAGVTPPPSPQATEVQTGMEAWSTDTVITAAGSGSITPEEYQREMQRRVRANLLDQADYDAIFGGQ